MPFKNMQRKRTYVTWQNMRTRCYYPGAIEYHSYGGRGITMCDRWRNSYSAFVADMGLKPAGMTIDRIDVNGNYEPGNCRWISFAAQQRNKRVPLILITIGSRTMCATDWARESGIERRTIRRRMRMGWPAEAAVFTPCTPRGRERSIRNPYTVNQRG